MKQTMRASLIGLSSFALAGCLNFGGSDSSASSSNSPAAPVNNTKDSQGCSAVQGANGVTITCGDSQVTILNGTNGTNGAAGTQGATGAQGPVGATGATGAPGPQGPQGLQGLQGPRGLQGPAGSATGSEFWLIKNDGTPLGRLVPATFNATVSLFVLWDDVNNMAVPYTNKSESSYAINSGPLFYQTADCSDTPHGGVSFMPTNMAMAGNGQLFRIESTADTFTPVAMRDVDGGCVTPLSGQAPNGAYNRLTLIASSPAPSTLAHGTFRIEKR